MSNNGKILVTGATGNLGSAVIANLIGSGANVRALQHREPITEDIIEAGVEVVVGDFLEPDTLDAAFEGVAKVFLNTPLGPDAGKMASNGLAAAKRTGNPHIVRHSEIPPEPVSNLRMGMLQGEINEMVEASGLSYTSMRPSFFMQNTMFAAQTVASDGMIYMPFKDGKVSMVDIRDVAEASAKALTTEGHEGKSYILTGPEPISFDEVASTLSHVLGKDVQYVSVPMQAARESMLSMGMSEWLTEAFCEYYENHSNGGSDFKSDDFEKLTGHSATSYDAFAHDFAMVFGGG